MDYQETNEHTDALKKEKIGKLLVQYSFPSIISNIAFVLYIIILQVSVARGSGLGDPAIGGIGVCMPVIMLVFALSTLTSVGASVRISIFLGKGDKKAACDVLGTALVLSLIVAGVFILMFFLFLNPILRLTGATDEIYPYAKEFLTIYIPISVVLVISSCLLSAMRVSGHPKKSMYISLFSFISSIFLICFFLFVLKWGIKGAALAVDAAVIISLLPCLIHFLKKDGDFPVLRSSLRLDPHIVRLIISIGFSPFLLQFSGYLTSTLVLNRMSAYGGDSAVSAYTITNTLTSIVFTILIGFSQGMQPIIGYNYGAKRMDRVFQTLKICAGSSVAIGLTGLLIVYFFGHLLVNLAFSPSPELAEKAVFCLRIVSLGMVFSGIQMTITSFFQNTGFAAKSFFLNLTREFVFVIPAVFIFPVFWGVDGIWYSLPITEFLSVLLGIAFFCFIQKKFVYKLNPKT